MEIAHPSRQNRAAFLICAAMLLLFGVLCYSAVLTKSATYDEPHHALGGWVALHRGDFRVDFSNPPVPFCWASLANGADALQLDTQPGEWAPLLKGSALSVNLAQHALFQSPQIDGPQFINRARFMMVLVGVALGGVIIAWSWKLAGAGAALIAATLFALDPNMLGHGPLVKNDVFAALVTGAAIGALWRAGQSLTLFRAALLTVLMTTALSVKFSMILLWPIVLVLLGIRALAPIPWNILGRPISRTGQKILAVVLLLLIMAFGAIAGTWMFYRFRFLPTRDPMIQIDPQMWRTDFFFHRYSLLNPPPVWRPIDRNTPISQAIQDFTSEIESLANAIADGRLRQKQSDLQDSRLLNYLPQGEQLLAADHALLDQVRQAAPDLNLEADTKQRLFAVINELKRPTQELAWELHFISYGSLHSHDEFNIFISLANFLLEYHLMPSAWTNGLMFQYSQAISRRNFLLGQVQDQGWWYYFPLAMLFKMPLATLIALLIATVIAIRLRTRWKDHAWAIACLIVPPLIIMTAAMQSNTNIGVRHVLPVYPFLYVAGSSVLANRLWSQHKRRIIGALAILLACESLLAWPNYIAYFNWACMGPRGGIHLLGDSNLDWGQDLPALAKWQHEHGDVPIALAYFGTADPSAYGVRADSLPAGSPPSSLLASHAIAISATNLQGIYGDGYVEYSRLEPTDILGGTIYLYDLRPRR